MPKAAHPDGSKTSSQSDDAYQQYLKERHSSHVAYRNKLDDLAFRTSERYDQWVFTLAGGALAISITFVEKIAPQPTHNSWILLGLSWLFYIGAILGGFSAIYYSRKAIYEAIKIADKIYGQFRATTTEKMPEGIPSPECENRFVKFVERLNFASLTCLGFGTVLMCVFALVNVRVTRTLTTTEHAKVISINTNLPQITNSVTNITTGKP